MRDSNLVIRLSEGERRMVDELQEEHAINISQYVRNKLIDLHNIFDTTSNGKEIHLLLPLETEIKQTLKKLREDFHCDPTRVLSDAMDDDIIKDALRSNLLAIYDHLKNT